MRKLSLTLLSTLLLCALVARADLVSFTDQGTFQAQGTIAFNSTFNDFGSDFSLPGGSFERGDVVYTSRENLIWGNATVFSNLSDSLIGNNYYTPITADLNTDTQYTMFGFQIAASGASTITYTLYTNLATYTFDGETVGNSLTGGTTFRGWTAGPGEFFYGIEIDAAPHDQVLAGLTHVQVGTLGPVSPVPDASATAGLLGLALAALAVARRRTRQ